MLVIVDYGSGNVGSIVNMLARAGIEATIGNSPEAIRSAASLILPGVGAFDSVIGRFSQSGLMDAVLERVRVGIPILGICVGMQILSLGSDEGDLPGLGLIRSRTTSLRSMIDDKDARIPHMGWSNLTIRQPSPLLQNLPQDARFYFVHSFAVVCDEAEQCIATIEYQGNDRITAIIQRDHIFGVQFHAEKSRNFGMMLLRNFAVIR